MFSGKLNEVWKNGKLVSKKPALLRRCVVDVYKKGDEKGSKGVERAFAICYSSLQKNGLMDGNKLTDKGRKKSYIDKEKDQEYEKIINQASKSNEECTMRNRKLRELLEEVQELSGMGECRTSLNEGRSTRDLGKAKKVLNIINTNIKSLRSILPELEKRHVDDERDQDLFDEYTYTIAGSLMAANTILNLAKSLASLLHPNEDIDLDDDLVTYERKELWRIIQFIHKLYGLRI